MKTHPITNTCSKNLLMKKHACFGISPFNSYFSENRIYELAKWGKSEFKSMHFFVPDAPSVYTLEALGYPAEKAAWKARRQCQYLFNKIHKALKSAGYSILEAEAMILNWEKLSQNTRFMSLYSDVRGLFADDPLFQKDCIEASRWVLEKRVQDESLLNEDALRSAARYLLTEIPLFVDTANIIGQPTSVFCYHQCIAFIEKIMNGYYSIKSSANQGFIVIEPLEVAVQLEGISLLELPRQDHSADLSSVEV